MTEEAQTQNPIAVSGHSHQIMNEEYRDIHILNPGSCTGAWPADTTSMMKAMIQGKDLELEIIRDF